MRIIQLEYLAIVYQMCDYSVKKTAERLKMSTRCLQNMAHEAEREKTLGHEVFKTKRIGPSAPMVKIIELGEKYYSKIFPTNEYRLRYRDNY